MEVTYDAVADHATATTLYAAIVTALYVRASRRKGSHVSTSLIANAIWAGATRVEEVSTVGTSFPKTMTNRLGMRSLHCRIAGNTARRAK
jgi:crotonobetainyl-CoA:carnitine CoA-transferase CaiB-like acyl-CoA transferase